MVATTILALFQSLLIYGLVIFIGKLLQETQQLRAFLGLMKENEDPAAFSTVTYWVQRIGRLTVIIGIFGMLVSVISTFTILTRL